jgi:tetratricopeptide (TPR) repeat protein
VHTRFTRFVALTTAVAFGSLAALSAQPPSAAALRAEGLQLGYNLDHAEALTAFRKAIAADPNDPTNYRLLAATAWILLLFQQGAITADDYLGQARATVSRATPDAALAATFHDAIARAQTLSEARLREHPDDADAHYQIGAAYGFLASYAATVEGRIAGSFGPARRAFKEHERALALAPARKDAGLVVGLYRYAVSDLSVPLRLVAYLAGMSGDRVRALQLVEDAARYPSDVQANAMFTLILMYNRESRYGDALRVIEELKERFPRNRLLWLEEGGTALRAGKFAEARAATEAGLARLAHDTRPLAPGEESRWRYTHGAALVGLKESSAAARELNAALPLATRDWVRGRIHKELGKVADLTGDRARALAEYRTADQLCRADRDATCSDDARALIKRAYQ